MKLKNPKRYNDIRPFLPLKKNEEEEEKRVAACWSATALTTKGVVADASIAEEGITLIMMHILDILRMRSMAK